MSGGGILPNGVPYSGSGTSLLAAQSISNVATLRAQVLHEIQRQGSYGRTADELEVALNFLHQTATPRCWELKEGGQIVMTSAKRRTRTGRWARVYIATGVPLPPGVSVVHSRSAQPAQPMNIFRDALIRGPNEEYRYALTRVWGPGPVLLWVLANPSKADGKKDDPTCVRGMGFSRRWQWGGMVFTNLGALRSTNPRDFLVGLAMGMDVVGPENDAVIQWLTYQLRYVICAWGDCLKDWGTKRGLEVKKLITDLGCTPYHLGLTDKGNPRHPLMLSYDTKPEVWK